MRNFALSKLFSKAFASDRFVHLQLKEEEMTRVTSKAFVAVVAAGLAMTALAGCNRDTASPGAAGEASGSASGAGAAAGKRACIILPDAASSSRWDVIWTCT